MFDFMTEELMTRFYEVLSDIKYELHRIADALEKKEEGGE